MLQAVNKTGGPLGIAILGSVLSAGYLARLHLPGLPPAAAAAVRQSVFGGVAVAQKLHSAALLASVQAAFVHGMDMALLVSAGIALAGVVLTLVFLPASNAPKTTVQPVMDTDGEAAGKQPAITGSRLRERTMATTRAAMQGFAAKPRSCCRTSFAKK
ncbi:MAG TPA: hypothetical protein DEH11_14000 [Actinobacteria bacterium]|nr:hypothetical protein [Actinomycetota bacterium]